MPDAPAFDALAPSPPSGGMTAEPVAHRAAAATLHVDQLGLRRPDEDAPLVDWNIDRYEELQDGAWDHECAASERDGIARRDTNVANGDGSRASARALRMEAAEMLAAYWMPRRAAAPTVSTVPGPTSASGENPR